MNFNVGSVQSLSRQNARVRIKIKPETQSAAGDQNGNPHRHGSHADFMTLDRRNHMTAWLGLIAMWLIVFAPIVSQLVMSARMHEQAGDGCAIVASGHDGHHTPVDMAGACGYCDLLANHAVLPKVPSAPLSTVLLVWIVATPVLSTVFAPLATFPSGRPRAPPVTSVSSH